MKINRQELQKALEIVKPGLANKEMIEQTTCFAFINARVITYNDSISISAPVAGINFTGAINADELYKFLSKGSSPEIELTISDTEIILKSGRAKAGLALRQEIILPLEEIGQIENWKKLSKGFIKAINFCRFSCSQDMSRPALTCLHVKKDGVIEASDGYRLTRYEIGEKMPVDTFLLPATSAQELLTMDVKEITKSNGWIHFRDKDDTVFSCRIFAEDFPDISTILVMKDGFDFTLPKELNEILDRARVFAKQELIFDETVVISTEGRKLIVSSHTDNSWFNEWARLEEKTTDFSFSIHPIFLQDIITHLQKCSIIPKLKITFVGDKWIHVIALRA